jgi:hypothetical protein
MPKYAVKTDVSVAKSKAEIEDTLQRYGASGFMSGWMGDTAMIAFQVNDRQVKFLLPMPDKENREFTHSPQGRVRTKEATHVAWEQGCRQRWRALSLAIKAKLEAVECGIVTFDQEFLAHIVGPNGRPIGETIIPQINAGTMPRLMLTQ